jgi:hypothetical protein
MGRPIEVAVPRFTTVDHTTRTASSDPLGLGPISERIADRLVPGITNRMGNPHLLTAVALASLVAEDLGCVDEFERRRVMVAFEWILLASFVRRSVDLTSIPGSTKARTAAAAHQSLGRANYLSDPASNGLGGILRPLLQDIGVITKDRGIGLRGEELLDRWATEQQLDGLLAGTSSGGALRRRLVDAVGTAVSVGTEQLSSRMRLPGELAQVFAPGSGHRAGEFSFLRDCLLEPDRSNRGQIGRFIKTLTSGKWSKRDAEREHVERLRQQGCSESVLHGLRAIRSFESLSLRLTVVFEEWQERAVHSSVTHQAVAASPSVRQAATKFNKSLVQASEAVNSFIGDDPDVTRLVERCASVDDSKGLSKTVITLHDEVQENRGNPSWFLSSGDGRFRLRPSRALNQPRYDLAAGGFVHAYRLAAFHRMLAGLT